jgi:hypothetical protein
LPHRLIGEIGRLIAKTGRISVFPISTVSPYASADFSKFHQFFLFFKTQQNQSDLLSVPTTCFSPRTYVWAGRWMTVSQDMLGKYMCHYNFVPFFKICDNLVLLFSTATYSSPYPLIKVLPCQLLKIKKSSSWWQKMTQNNLIFGGR